MPFTSGQWGPDTFIDSAGNTTLIGATVTATGYVCTVSPLGNLTVTGPAADAVVLTVTPAVGAVYTVTVPVRPLVTELEAVQAKADAALPTTTANATYEALANKGAANGYAPLGADSKVPTANLPASVAVSDATTTSKGIVQLAGDLGGTAAAPTVPGLAAHEADTTAVHGIADTAALTASAEVDTFVVLTEAAFTALATKDARTVYLRTP